MPKLSSENTPPPRVLLWGESTVGKTGSLAMLANAGYRILLHDFDQNARVITNYLRPGHADVYIQTYDVARLTDAGLFERRMTDKGLRFSDKHETVYDAAAEQLNLFARLLQHWKTDTEDLGASSSWTPRDVVAVDSGTFMGELCLLAANKHPEATRNPQSIYRIAGSFMRNILNYLTSSRMGASVIVLTHVNKVGEKDAEGNLIQSTVREVPRGVGSKLSEDMSQYFSDVWRLTVTPTGQRQILTAATSKMGLRTSQPSLIKPVEPFDLASLFDRLTRSNRK